MAAGGAAVDTATAADRKVAQSKQRGRDARGVAQRARTAWRKAEKYFDAAVQTEVVIKQVEMALAIFRPDGELNDRQWAQEQLRTATKPLGGPEWGKVRRLLSDERTLHYLDWLHEQLTAAVEDPLRREACTHVWHLHEAMAHTQGEQRARLAQLVVMEQALCQRLWPEWQQAYAHVEEILDRVVRTSSAVECVNSVVRMHQARHRHISQGLLNLKRLYWNCRTFRYGKRKGACPYELLGLKLPTYGWWTLLQMDPKEVEKKLSTQKVAA